MTAGAELQEKPVNAAPRRRALASPPARPAFAVSTWAAALAAHAALFAVAATLTAAVLRHPARGPDLAPLRLELGGTGRSGLPVPSGREAFAAGRPEIPEQPPGEIQTAALPVPEGAASFLEGPTPVAERAGREDLMAGVLPGTRAHGRPGDRRGIRPGRGEPAVDPGGAPGGGGPGTSETADAGGSGAAASAGTGGDGGDGWARRSGGRLPHYPVTARRRGWEGTVTLALEVAADGAVREVAIQESSGHGVLDDEAVEAARTWTFAPALRDGRPAATRVSMPVTFRLTE